LRTEGLAKLGEKVLSVVCFLRLMALKEPEQKGLLEQCLAREAHSLPFDEEYQKFLVKESIHEAEREHRG